MEVSFNSWHPVLYPLAPCDYLSLSELKIKWNLKFSFSVTLAVLVSSHMWLVATILDSTDREHCQYFKAFYWIVPTGSPDESTNMQLHKIWFNLINFILYSFILTEHYALFVYGRNFELSQCPGITWSFLSVLENWGILTVE